MELNDYEGNYIPIETTFSSYPGCLSSTDDFYVTNHRLMVTETTIEVIDVSIYDNVKKEEEYIPNFMRVNSATFFSKSGKEWVDDISYNNSGTYSSQWMVVDYNKFENVKNEVNKNVNTNMKSRENNNENTNMKSRENNNENNMENTQNKDENNENSQNKDENNENSANNINLFDNSGILYVLEQTPNRIVSHDVSKYLYEVIKILIINIYSHY